MGNSEKTYSSIVVGAGPIGLACGIELEKAGLSYLIIDKGCLVNSIYNYPANMTFFSTSDRLEIGDVPFISNNPKPTRPEALEYYRRVTMSWKLRVRLYESIVSAEKKTDDLFQVITDKNEYICENVIIATGFYDLPYLLNIPGETLPKVKHYYSDPHPYFGMKVLVIGAANSAVDVALETYRKGAAEVTMVIRESEIRSSVKYWVKPDIENRIREGEIKTYFNSQVNEITESKVRIQTPEREIEIENDFVLAMTGYQPDFSFLTTLGIEIGDDEFKTPHHNNKTMETNVKGIYLAGVICGGLKTNRWFIENSRVHANLIVQALLNKLNN